MDNNDKTLENTILSYLQKKKVSGDTLKGIAKWWLEIERIEISVDRVAHVLGNLVQQGIVERLELDKQKQDEGKQETQDKNGKGEYFLYRLRGSNRRDSSLCNPD